jgi:outer membrane protein assembly factor BamB
MKNAFQRMAIVAGCVVLFGSIQARTEDWPQWRGANRDGKAVGFSAPQTWPKDLTKKWSGTVGKGDATPALADGKLYAFTRLEEKETILCLEAATGKELWRNQYETQDAEGASRQHSGPRSSPSVAEGKVVTMGVRGILSCLDAATGKLAWRKNDFAGVWPRFFTSSSPIIVNGLAVAQCGGEGNGAIVAYDLANGDQKWKWAEEGTAYSSPVLMTVDGVKQIVALTAKSVVGLGAADGKLLWQSPFPASGRMTYNAATPILDDSTVIFCGQGRGSKAVKIGKAGDAMTAKELWSNPDNAVRFNTPVLRDNLLFGLSERNTYFCENAQNGQTFWTKPGQGGGRQGGFGSIVDAGSVLLALTPSGELVVLQPNAKEYRELASYKVADSPTYAYPVAVGNRIYIKDQDSITLWTVE